MATTELVIKPRKGWQPFDFREAYLYRELLAFLIWRDIKIRYRQTLLGGLWSILQPLAGTLIFVLVFNRWAGVHSDGPPYSLFAFAGLAPWTFFSNSVTNSSNSLIASQQLVSRVYFPRIFIPLGTIGALLLDLAISLAVLGCMMIYYRWTLSANVLLLPVFLLGTVMAASGIGFAFSALNVLFRDVKYMVPFLLQMGLFVTPVIYPVRYVPSRWQTLFGLNPMSGMVLGFRYCLLGSPVYWPLVLTSLLMCLILFFAGLMLFRRIERLFADVI
jgi:lipopolysaccharide transport system permease protein